MEDRKEHTSKDPNPEENKLFCEKYKEWVDEGKVAGIRAITASSVSNASST